jgi:uncharacterized membrane protein YdjX (TVP38/TMEM64 family)
LTAVGPPHTVGAMPRLSRTHLRIAAVVGVVVVLAAAWRLGVLHVFSDAGRLRDTLRGLGTTGYVAFVVAFIVLQPFGVPGMVFVLGATYVWPKPIALALSFVGALGAANAGFLFARFVARDWVSARLPARLRAYDERLEKNGLATTLVLRIIFWMNPFLHGLLGLSRIGFFTHLFATAVALAPALALIVWVGSSVIDVVRDLPAERAVPWLVVVAAAFVGWRVYKWRAGRQARVVGDDVR